MLTSEEIALLSSYHIQITGPSGSGKSTIVQLIERFYDPKSGDILLDNTNIKDIKIKNLRESIGYVS